MIQRLFKFIFVIAFGIIAFYGYSYYNLRQGCNAFVEMHRRINEVAGSSNSLYDSLFDDGVGGNRCKCFSQQALLEKSPIEMNRLAIFFTRSSQYTIESMEYAAPFVNDSRIPNEEEKIKLSEYSAKVSEFMIELESWRPILAPILLKIQHNCEV